MSDDPLLGTVCCIPRRVFCILLGGLCFAYGFGTIIYFTLFWYIRHNVWLTPQHCQGHMCFELVSCHGLQSVTEELRMILLVGGGAAFGLLGALGAYSTRADQVYLFACFLAAMIAVFLFNLVFDACYTGLCGMYSGNIINLALRWDIPNLPIAEGLKAEVALLQEYRVRDVDGLAQRRVFSLYLGVVAACVAFLAFAFRGVWWLYRFLECGTAGLGPNFDLRGLDPRGPRLVQDYGAVAEEEPHWHLPGYLPKWKSALRGPVPGAPKWWKKDGDRACWKEALFA